ncbi:hypothetical protein F3G46_30260, partial [Klebsiella pneumoniae]
DNWTLQQRDLLNPNSLGQPAYNIELTASHEAVWQAGDIAEIQPGNSPERINKFLQHHHILKNAVVDSLQVSIEKALWNKDLTGEIEPFANLDHLLEQLPTLPT